MGRVLRASAKKAPKVERGNAIFFEGEKALALVKEVRSGEVLFFDRSFITLTELAARISEGKASIYEN